MTIQYAGSIAHGCTFGTQSVPERNLLGGQFRWTAEAYAFFLGSKTTDAGSLSNQRAFKLGDARKNSQHHLARRRGRVCPRG